MGHIFDYTDFDGRIISLPESGPWRLKERINASCHNQDLEHGFAESTAVFVCEALTDNPFTAHGVEAIMKVWLQHDPSRLGGGSPQHSGSGSDSDDTPYSLAHSELYWLDKLLDRGCRSIPQWYESNFDYQVGDMPYPGGFQNCIVEQKLPGRNLSDFFTRYTEAERDEIRKEFVQAIKYVSRYMM